MKVVIQRTSKASVCVDGQIVGEIDKGLVVLVGVTHDDTMEDVKYIVNKIVHLRIFEDENKKMNLSLKDVNGSILSISQFTLYGDTQRGRRPSFTKAASPDHALKLYESFNALVAEYNIKVET